MKTFLLVFLSVWCAVGIGAVAKDRPDPVPQKHQAAAIQLTYIMGTVRDGGEKLSFVTDERAWNVDNPEILKGHEGHYVRVYAHVYPDEGSIQITEVTMPTAAESRRNDER